MPTQTQPAALDTRFPHSAPACVRAASQTSDRVQTRSRPNSLFWDTLGLRYGGEGGPPQWHCFRSTRSLVAALGLLLGTFVSHAQIAPLAPAEPPAKPQKHQKPPSENIEWIWQYTPDDAHKEGRENDLLQDVRFRPLLEQYLTAPQSFWGTPIDGRPRTLATTALDHLTVPGKVIAEDKRYVTITGCVVHFCPARGLLWIDLNGAPHLVVFAAIDWIKEGRPTTDPTAEYTLWLFPNVAMSTPPAVLTKAIARWSAEPLPGLGIVQRITHAILVDPDGTPHEIAPSTLGISVPKSSNADTEEAPSLKPRN